MHVHNLPDKNLRAETQVGNCDLKCSKTKQFSIEIRSAGTRDTEGTRAHCCRGQQISHSLSSTQKYEKEFFFLKVSMKQETLSHSKVLSFIFSVSYPGRGMHFLSSHCRPGR